MATEARVWARRIFVGAFVFAGAPRRDELRGPLLTRPVTYLGGPVDEPQFLRRGNCGDRFLRRFAIELPDRGRRTSRKRPGPFP